MQEHSSDSFGSLLNLLFPEDVPRIVDGAFSPGLFDTPSADVDWGLSCLDEIEVASKCALHQAACSPGAGQQEVSSAGATSTTTKGHTHPYIQPAVPKKRPRRRAEGQWSRNKRKHDQLLEELSRVRSTLEQLSVNNRYLQNKSAVLDFLISNMNSALAHHEQQPKPTELRVGRKEGAPCAAVTSLGALHVQGNTPKLAQAFFTDPRSALYVSRWKEFVSQCSALLVEEEGKYTDLSSSPRLQELASGLCRFVRGGMARPERFFMLMSINLETCSIEDPPPQFWQNAVLNIRLTEVQRQDFLTTFDDWMAKVDQIWQQRNSSLQQAVQHSAALEPDQGRAAEAAHALHRAQTMQHQFTLLMVGIMFRRILRADQVSQLVVQCYPYCPDPVAIVEAVRSIHSRNAKRAPLVA